MPQSYECKEVIPVASHDLADEADTPHYLTVDGDNLYVAVGPHILVWAIKEVHQAWLGLGARGKGRGLWTHIGHNQLLFCVHVMCLCLCLCLCCVVLCCVVLCCVVLCVVLCCVVLCCVVLCCVVLCCVVLCCVVLCCVVLCCVVLCCVVLCCVVLCCVVLCCVCVLCCVVVCCVVLCKHQQPQDGCSTSFWLAAACRSKLKFLVGW